MASKEYHRKHARDWNLAHPDRVKATNKRYQEKHLEVYREGNKKHRRKNRQAAIDHYGGKCACCGEDRFEFLAINHIEGGGHQHRKTIKGIKIEEWLKKNNYPSGFNVLCHNCNMALGFYGYCPHKGQEG
jgi:hypothetical protein